MPIVYYPCLILGQAWNLIENLSAFLKYRHMVNRMLFFKLGTEFQSHNYGAMVAIQPLYSHDISFWNGFSGTKMTRKRMVNYFSCSVKIYRTWN